MGKVSFNAGTYSIPASVGTRMGGNLFESFSQFNLAQGQVADFLGPSSVQDIIARITGGRSSINGTIESGIEGANLFLIDPAGVLFGPAASLDIGGAFTVSTADYMKLAGGGRFNASLGGEEMLTAGAVNAFGFSSAAPAPVSFRGSQLEVPTGTGLNVIAGNVTLDGATLFAPSGGLTIFSAASAGEVPFSLSTPGAGYGTAHSSISRQWQRQPPPQLWAGPGDGAGSPGCPGCRTRTSNSMSWN
jgi:filamentous hemagglutinin family protein